MPFPQGLEETVVETSDLVECAKREVLSNQIRPLVTITCLWVASLKEDVNTYLCDFSFVTGYTYSNLDIFVKSRRRSHQELY